MKLLRFFKGHALAVLACAVLLAVQATLELSLPTYCAQNPAHDLVLADRYFSLSQSERETWRTESQSREDVYAEIRSCGTRGRKERAGERVGEACKRDGCPCQMPSIRALTVFLWPMR